MKIRKTGVILIISLLILPLILQLVIAQEIPGLPSQLTPEEIEKIKQELEELKNQTKWQYLGKQWQENLLKNKFIADMDNVLKKFTYIFFILFGEHYSLSLALLGIIALWIYFLVELSQYFVAFSPRFSNWIALAMVVIMAQLNILRKFVETITWIIFSEHAWWVRVILIGLVIVGLFFLHFGARALQKKRKENRQESAIKKAEAAGDVVIHTATGSGESFGAYT